MNNITKIDAIASLRPGASWSLRGDELEWLDENLSQPSDEEIDEEVVRLQADYDSKEYQRLRALEYPPMVDYLDAVVKSDEEQKQAYIDACLAVKAKYPKPEGV